MKKINYILSYFFIYLIFNFFQYIPISFVSLIGGKLFEFFGPLSKKNKLAIKNYKIVFPQSGNKEIEEKISKSWNNLGKTFSEISILNKLLKNRIKITGLENIKELVKKNEQVIFFSIHQSNWELLVPFLDKSGIMVGAIYRHLNNPYINKLILRLRNKSLDSNNSFYTPKGKDSAKDILMAINQGKSMIVLVDQKDNSGDDVSLFNRKVKTQLGFLKIAKKYNLRLVPICVKRTNINNFEIIIDSPLSLFNNNKNHKDAMLIIHNIVERWIKLNPEQWLWQHNRFN